MNDPENSKNSKKKSKLRDEEKDPLLTDLAKACRGLVFVSETDADLVPFVSGEVRSRSLRSYLSALRIDDSSIEESSFDGLFNRLTTEKDWHRGIDKNRVIQFSNLRKVLESKLDDLRVIRIGRVRIDIFIVGVDAKGRLAGVKTKAIET